MDASACHAKDDRMQWMFKSMVMIVHAKHERAR